ncbi:MAG TPA: YkgJ family cysteine cluster protein [Verrucomicrobiae bacterium]|nr:YkgJ family cysteine cluster protein [Verrucomicrobiae bacterium]
MEPPDLQERLAAFQCRRCNRCCEQPGFVYVTPPETEAMAALLGLDPFDFVNRYCEIEDRKKLVLKKNPDESCVFLTREGCSVHAAKPAQCRDFPVRWRTPRSFEYCEGMKALFPKADQR